MDDVASTLRALATRVRRQTTNSDILSLCDAVLQREGCVVCAARRAVKAASQKRFRDNANGKEAAKT